MVYIGTHSNGLYRDTLYENEIWIFRNLCGFRTRRTECKLVTSSTECPLFLLAVQMVGILAFCSLYTDNSNRFSRKPFPQAHGSIGLCL